MVRTILFPLSMLVCLLGFATSGSAVTNIKFAIITPEGSTWTNLLHEMDKDIQTKTGGKVKLTIYAGGVSGDELDVLRKMKSARIHAGGFSGVGLGVLVPEVRILEAPLLFQSYEELDHVKEKLFDRFAAAFDKKGYVLLGFAEAGFVHVFSKVKIDSDAGLKKMKMWVWKGDLVAETFLNEFGIRTTPLHLADVNTGLETGMIDSFYSPPLAAIAFQWYAKVQYMLDYPFVNSTGAVIMNKRQFNRMSKAEQAIVQASVKEHCDKIVAATRKENDEAKAVIKETGITFTKAPQKDVDTFHTYAKNVYAKSIPKLYSQDLLDEVNKILKDFRAK